MLTKGDIADVIAEYLSTGAAPCDTRSAAASGKRVCRAARASAPLPKRVFISDWEMKRLAKPGQRSVKVPVNAIISPLSADWLDYNGIEIVRE